MFLISLASIPHIHKKRRLQLPKRGDSMDMVPVNSSNLQSVGYDLTNEYLDILFHTGRKYRYSDVPESIYTGLMQAPSKGKYHNQYIKNSFDCNELN